MTTTGVVLVLKGQTKATICAPADGPEGHAAERLQHYVREMSGAELPIANHDTPARIVIRVVDHVAAHDGFRLQVRNGAVSVEASEARGCVYGVHALLEELGCRFYGPEPVGVVIPHTDTLMVPASLNIRCEPSFPRRLPPDAGTPEQHMQWGFNHLLTDAAHLDVQNTLGRSSSRGFGA